LKRILPRSLKFPLAFLFFLTFAVACYMGLVRAIGIEGFLIATLVFGPVMFVLPWLVPWLVFDELRRRRRTAPQPTEATHAEGLPRQADRRAENRSRSPRRRRTRVRNCPMPGVRFKY
jgi:hypothetical protein